ncbi:MAG: hypothetical protein ACYTG0_14095 [Planctomycetota bacterium]|jgi:hypothetical protein
MGKAEDHLSETRPKARGIARDLKRLKSDVGATAAELREFLGQMHGRSPQEMIGLVAKSGLTRSMFLATFLFVLLLAALTVIPYALRHHGADASAPVAGEGTVEEENPTEPDQPETTQQPAKPAAAAPVGTEDTGTDPERAIDAMGIGETRVADPNKNPLEDKLDNLLDGIE